jgi:hypothetical protein
MAKTEEKKVEANVPSDEQVAEAGAVMVEVEVVRDSGYPRHGTHYLKGQRVTVPEHAARDAESAKPPFVKRVK